MGIQLSDWVENIVGKREIARYEQFLFFPLCFQKLTSDDVSKWVSMEWRDKAAYVFEIKVVCLFGPQTKSL